MELFRCEWTSSNDRRILPETAHGGQSPMFHRANGRRRDGLGRVLTGSMATAKGVILLYSIVSRSTFNRLEEIRKLVMTKDEDAILILVGNKCDSATGREVSIEEGAAMARQFGCQFIEASAKTAQNVELVFATLIRALRKTRGDTIGTSSTHAEPTQLRKRKNRFADMAIEIQPTRGFSYTHTTVQRTHIKLEARKTGFTTSEIMECVISQNL